LNVPPLTKSLPVKFGAGSPTVGICSSFYIF
jgi:hypothetical protein